jgi:hypothetical protein
MDRIPLIRQASWWRAGAGEFLADAVIELAAGLGCLLT